MISHISWSSSGVSALPNIFLEDIMIHALENHNGTSSIGRSQTPILPMTSIDGIAREEDELARLVQNLDTAATKFGIEINAEENKMMTSNGTLNRDITILGLVGNSRSLQIPRCHNL